MTYSSPLTFDDLLDNRSAKPLRRIVVALCAIVAALDGYDTQAIALAAPAISRGWGVGAGAFGIVFGIGLLGSLVGALVLGRLADRLGRRRVLVLSVSIFAVCSLATPLASSVSGLVVIRLLTGLGLGGALPCAIALTSEYTPQRSRGATIGLMFCGFPLGGVLAGLAAAPIVSFSGWEGLFVVGGVLPLVLVPLLSRALPESAQFLTVQGDERGVDAVLRRLGVAVKARDLAPSPTAARSALVRLFTEGRAAGTTFLWVTIFLALLFAYLLVNWIPLVTRAAGAGEQTASIAVAALNLGAIAGCLAIGRLADRWRPTLVVGAGFVLAAVAIVVLGHIGVRTGAVLTATFVAGFLGIGSQMCLAAVCADFYETSLRATGVGATMGVGRIGGIVGPVVGGVLVTAGAAAADVFSVAAGAAVVAAIAIIAMGAVTPRRRSGPAEAIPEASGSDAHNAESGR